MGNYYTCSECLDCGCFALIGETFHLRIVLFELWLCECFCHCFVLALFGELCVVLCGWWFFFLGDDEIWGWFLKWFYKFVVQACC